MATDSCCGGHGQLAVLFLGTLVDSVRQVVGQGRTPVLNPHPQALRLLRCADLKPILVLVRPPPFPALKESRCAARARSTFDSNYGRGFTDDELQQMLASAAQLQHSYGHWFDYVLVNGNLEFAFRELCDFLQRVDLQPPWVPCSWLH